MTALPLFPDHVRCGTCRWWTPPNPGSSYRPRRTHGGCQAASWDGCDGEAVPVGMAFAVEGSSEGYGVATRSDFGCRLWEPREPTSASR